MKSIQSRISASIITAAIVPLIIMLIFQQREMYEYKKEVRTEMLDSAHLISEAINGYVIERVKDLKILSSNIDLLEKNENYSKKIEHLLSILINEVESIRLLCVIEINGRHIAQLARGDSGEKIVDLADSYNCKTRIIEKHNFASITGTTHMVTVYDPGYLDDHLINTSANVMPISVEVNYPGNTNRFKVFAYIDMEKFHKILLDGIVSVKEMDVSNIEIELVDNLGDIILQRNNKPIIETNKLSDDISLRLIDGEKISLSSEPVSGWLFTEINEHNEEHLVNYYRLSKNDDVLGLRWTVVLHQSTNELFSFVNKWYLFLVFIIVLIFVFSVVMGLISSHIIASPLRSLAGNIDLFRNDVTNTEIKGVERDDEVGKLAKSFSLMRDFQVQRTEIMQGYVDEYQELKYALDNAQQLMMNSPDAIVTVDHEGNILTINPAANQLLGYEENELRSQPVEKIIPKRYKSHTELRSRFIQRPSYRPMGSTKKLMALHKDGYEIPVSISLSPVESYKGRQVVATIRDESKRIQYETEMRKLAAVAENTNNLVIVTDRWGKIDWVNLSFERKTGYLLHEIRGKKPGDILQGPETDKSAIKHMREAVRKGEPIHIEVLNYTKNKNPIWLDMNIQPVKGEYGIENFISIESDITDRRRLEEDLINANVNLELRVKERTKQLEDALEKTGAAAKAKAAFLATMSHEIRTPMNGVVGMLELVERTSLDDKQKKMLNTVRNSSNALLTIIDDILDFSKVEAGKLELCIEEVMLVDLVDEVIDSLSMLALDKSINIIVEAEPGFPKLLADPVRIRQILFNLTGNAIKFTNNKGYVEININKQRIVDDMMYVTISVSDNGIGIEQETQLKLFQPFTQADESTTREFGGTGLGLSICASLVELMGGEIEVVSVPGEGSTFSVVVPLKVPGRIMVDSFTMSDIKVLQFIHNEKIKHKLTNALTKLGATVFNCESVDNCEYFISSDVNEDINVIISDLGSGDAMAGAILISESAEKYPDAHIIYLRPVDDVSEYPGGVKFTGNPLHIQQIIYHIYKNMNKTNALFCVNDEVVESVTDTDNQIFSGMKILVVEDNELNQEMIKLQLDEIGINSSIVEDGKKALNSWIDNDFDLILTDCHMPEMDGFELTREVRKREKEFSYDRIPIIAITANALNGELENCTKAGMDDYLTKPVGLNKLQSTIRKWIFSEGKLNIVDKCNDDETEDFADKKTPVDIKVISALIGNDVSMRMKILDKFISTTPGNITEIEGSINCKKPDDVKSLAHKLKSSARAVGAHTLSDLCQSLENMSIDFDEKEARSVLVNLEAEYMLCERYIREYSESCLRRANNG